MSFYEFKYHRRIEPGYNPKFNMLIESSIASHFCLSCFSSDFFLFLFLLLFFSCFYFCFSCFYFFIRFFKFFFKFFLAILGYLITGKKTNIKVIIYYFSIGNWSGSITTRKIYRNIWSVRWIIQYRLSGFDWHNFWNL